MSSLSERVRHQQTLYASRNPTRRWLHTSRREWIIAAIGRTAAKRHKRALEIGSGSGVYLPTLAQHYDQVVASDLEAFYLKHAQSLTAKYRNLTFQVDDI